MPRNPWVKQNQTSKAEMERAYKEFAEKGGQIDQYSEDFDPKKFVHSETAVRLKLPKKKA